MAISFNPLRPLPLKKDVLKPVAPVAPAPTYAPAPAAQTNIDPNAGPARLQGKTANTDLNAGAGFTAYPDQAAPQLTPAAPIQKKPQTIYQQMLEKRLAGHDPIVENAQAQQKTNASLNEYQALRQAQQTGTQGGLQQGGLQYQRGIDKAQAGAAEENLQGQDRVNALTRDRSTEALNLSKADDLESNRKDEAFIASLPPKAQQHLRQIQAAGGDVQGEYAKMIDANGTLVKGYQDATPGQTKLQGYEDDIRVLHPDWSDERVTAAALTKLGKDYDTENQPLDEAGKARVKAAVKAGTITDFTQGEGKGFLDNLDNTNPITAFTNSKEVDAWAKANVGEYFKIDNQPFKVVGANLEWIPDGGNVKSILVTDPINHRDVYIGQNGKQYIKGANGVYTYADGTPIANGKAADVNPNTGEVNPNSDTASNLAQRYARGGRF